MLETSRSEGDPGFRAVNSRLWGLRARSSYSDVKIVCPGPFSPRMVLAAHRLILAANSEYFRELFDFLDATQGPGSPLVVFLPVVTVEVMTKVLEFLYMGSASWKENELEAVLKVASYLRIEDLKDTVAAAIQARDVGTRGSVEVEVHMDASDVQGSLGISPVSSSENEMTAPITAASENLEPGALENEGRDPEYIIMTNEVDSHLQPTQQRAKMRKMIQKRRVGRPRKRHFTEELSENGDGFPSEGNRIRRLSRLLSEVQVQGNANSSPSHCEGALEEVTAEGERSGKECKENQVVQDTNLPTTNSITEGVLSHFYGDSFRLHSPPYYVPHIRAERIGWVSVQAISPNEEDKYHCIYRFENGDPCGFRTSQEIEIKKHEKTHVKEERKKGKLQCPNCSFMFETEAERKNHVDIAHRKRTST